MVNYAEPVGSAAPVAVQRTAYAYQYLNLAPNAAPVVGWCYDGVSKAGSSGTAVGARAFAVARYELLTDFQLSIGEESTTTYDASTGATVNSSATRYAYNNQGQLAMVVRPTSAGGVIRTRYKYLSDYHFPTATTDPNLQALVYRVSQEHLTTDLLETITEVVPPNTVGGRLAGISLNTFRQDVASGPTRPFQTLRWQTATPLPHAQFPTDTTKVIGQGWQVSPRLRVETTVEEVSAGALQIPVTVSRRAGGTINSLHLGYNMTLPVLQMANAYASEARFSNFEQKGAGDAAFAWQTTTAGTARTTAAARTGSYGLRLASTQSISTLLPAVASGSQLPPVTTGFRIAAFIRATLTGQITIQISRPATTAVFARTVPILGGNTGWQYVSVVASDLIGMGITPTNRQEFSATITNTGGQPLDFDDVLLLPAAAAANMLTYNPLGEKTTETDANGRTTSFDYTPAGRLRAVRDHQGNLIKRIEQVVGGRSVDERPLGFTVTANAAISASNYFHEGQVLVFTPYGLCEDAVTYEWSFGCAGCASTQPVPTFQYPVTGQQNAMYTVTLRATTSLGTQTSTQNVYLIPPLPPTSQLQFTTCTAGPLWFDTNGNAGPSTSCPGLSPPGNLTEFKVNVISATTSLTYNWELRLLDGYNASWRGSADPLYSHYVISGQNTNVLRVGHNVHPVEYRCRINYYVSGIPNQQELMATSPDFITEIQNNGNGN